MRLSRSQLDALLAAGGGLVFAASTPPIDFEPGILLGLSAFAASLFARDGVVQANSEQASPAAQRTVAHGAWCGFVFGLVANLIALRFVPEVIARFTPLPEVLGYLALLLLSAAQALPWAIGGALAARLTRPRPGAERASTPNWLAFAICVYAASFVPTVFPWTPAGGLARWPALLQVSELVGERGASFFVAIACGLASGSVVSLLRGSRRAAARQAAFATTILTVLSIYGAFRIRAIDAARAAAAQARVALLSPDFDATFRWEEDRATMMIDRLSAMTKRAEQEGAVLTIWPESAYPYTLPHGTRHSPRGPHAVLQQGARGPVLTGAYLAKGGGLGTNSAILVAPDGQIGPSYDKRHLLWFGETVPLADTFPFLRQIFARGTGIAPGTESVPFTVGPIVLAVLNCYEDTLPAAGREAMSVRPNLLVNVTNDAWFTGSAEGELHLRLSVLRAIETRRDLVRAVNRGPTAWVDAAGRVRARRDSAPGLGPPPPLVVDAALLDAPVTLYARAGDAPLGLLVIAALVVPWARRRMRERATRSAD